MPTLLSNLAHRLIAVAGTALVLQFFSEFYFLNEGPAAMAAGGFPPFPRWSNSPPGTCSSPTSS